MSIYYTMYRPTKLVEKCQCCQQRVAFTNSHCSSNLFWNNNPSQIVCLCQVRTKIFFSGLKPLILLGFLAFRHFQKAKFGEGECVILGQKPQDSNQSCGSCYNCFFLIHLNIISRFGRKR